ncbi:MAG: GGDEF domain-containing protein [Sterolibacterium sp.]|nr:GGDEF domain-containing protein [Sterolibacterium sp.]
MSSGQLSINRRQSTPVPAEDSPNKRSLFDSILANIAGFNLQDICSTRRHSDDFKETRAEYLALRLRFMAFFYAVAIPLWAPVDYLLVRPEHFTALLIPKFLLSAFLLPLGFLTLRRLSSKQVDILLALAFLAPSLFYMASMWIFNQGVPEATLAGYALMPFLMVSMLGVFPLTMTYGAAMIALITSAYLCLEFSLGKLLTIETANMLWVFVMLGGVSLWIQSGQLLMLLKLYRESTQDPLTGMINRRVLMKRLVAEIERIGEGKTTFCILMFDLDRFKRVNDNYGHLMGDKVLKTAATLLREGLRQCDIVARFGGEEFVAVLPDCGSEEATAVAERIRESCYAARVTAPNGDLVQLSTCVGVTEYEPGEAIEVTLNRVDELLYTAKEGGRNRVVHGQSEGFIGTT